MSFANLSKLKKDDNGVWPGRATKDGKTVNVSLENQGNVIQAGTQGTTAPSNAARRPASELTRSSEPAWDDVNATVSIVSSRHSPGHRQQPEGLGIVLGISLYRFVLDDRSRHGAPSMLSTELKLALVAETV